MLRYILNIKCTYMDRIQNSFAMTKVPIYLDIDNYVFVSMLAAELIVYLIEILLLERLWVLNSHFEFRVDSIRCLMLLQCQPCSLMLLIKYKNLISLAFWKFPNTISVCY